MNTRFIMPASIAAAAHVALLWFLPVEPYTPVAAIIEVPLPPWPKPPEEVVTLPVTKSDDTVPVRPLPSQPSRPELPDEIITRKSDAPTIPVESRTLKPADKVTVIAKEFVPGDGPFGPGGPGGPPIFKSGDLDRVPNAKVQVAPEYPFALKHEGANGSVLVEFDVDRSGQVSSARVVRSTRREFEEPTLRAVLKWRFEPGRRHGATVPFRMVVPVEFSMEN